MSWDAVLAAVGGGAGGAYNAQKFYQQDETKRQLAELRAMLAQVAEEGRNERNAAGIKSREEMAAEARKQKDADREQRATKIANDMIKFGATNDRIRAMADQSDATKRRGQDINEGLGWDASNRGWSFGQQGIDTTQRGQDITAATSRGNAQLAADTSRANAATAADTAGVNTRARIAMGLMNLEGKEKGNILSNPNNPTDWADQFDQLWNNPNLATQRAVQAMQSTASQMPAGPAGPTPTESLQSPVQAPAPVPVGPRGGTAVAPSSAAPAPPPPAAVPVQPRGAAGVAPAAAPQATAPTVEPRAALAVKMTSLVQKITGMPPGPARDEAKRDLAALRAQAALLRGPVAAPDGAATER